MYNFLNKWRTKDEHSNGKIGENVKEEERVRKKVYCYLPC